jgi:hypothetical protein
MGRFGQVLYEGMARGQKIAFTVAVAFGIAMCAGLALGRFTPAAENGETASVAPAPLMTSVVAQKVSEIEPKKMRVIRVGVAPEYEGWVFDLAMGEATVGKWVDLLDTSAPLPSALREVK